MENLSVFSVTQYLCNKNECPADHHTAVYRVANELLVVADGSVLYQVASVSDDTFKLSIDYLAMIIATKLHAKEEARLKFFQLDKAWSLTVRQFYGKIDIKHLAQTLCKKLSAIKNDRFSMAGCSCEFKLIEEKMPNVKQLPKEQLRDAKTMMDVEVITGLLEKFQLAFKQK